MKKIDPQTWRRAQPILDEALGLSGSDRTVYLNRACADDEELRRCVERLLRADDESGDFLERPAVAMVEVWADSESETVAAGVPRLERVGPYRVTAKIAEGGMGAVYRAARDDGQFEQDVALKLIRQGKIGSEIQRRFLQERQILARLQHPHIARLLDGGMTQDGQPYFAMEYIEGTPLTTYCDEHRLSIHQRLGLFFDVCDAVQHAHQNLIVHRDLKPANILVTGDGEVKLLDFGIAKLLDEGDGADPAAQTVVHVMTPDYAAPEQVRGEAITTATDVYALGLVLYELLTGHKACEISNPTPLKLQRAVLEQDPTRPSRVIAQTTRRLAADGSEPDVTPETVSRARRTTPTQLRHRLDGDLDAICMVALRKEPEHRYASAEALGQDLKRFDGHLPVLARQGSHSYRFRKFVRRNRANVFVATIVLLSLVGGLAAALWQAQLAADERDRALEAEARATAIRDFLVEEMLESAAPEIAQGREITVTEVLASATDRVEGAFADQPNLAASVHGTLGRTYMSLGDYEASQRQLKRSHALFKATMGPQAAETLRANALLADLYVRQGDVGLAEQVLTPTLATQRRQFGRDALDTLVSEGIQAALLYERGEFFAAQLLMESTLTTMEQYHPGAWQDRLNLMTQLVNTLDQQRKNVQSEAVARRTLALQRERLGPEHPDVMRTMEILGRALTRLERDEDAVAMLSETLALKRRVLGREHPGMVRTLAHLALVYTSLARYADAKAVRQEAVEISRTSLGIDHPTTVKLGSVMASSLYLNGETAAADTMYRYTIDGCIRVLGEAHPSTLKVVKFYSYFLFHTDRDEEAYAAARRFIRMAEEASTQPDVDAVVLNDFAWYLLRRAPKDLRDPEAALPLAERAVASSQRKQPEFLDTLANAYYQLGDLDEAIETQREVVQLPGSVVNYGDERRMVQYLREKGDEEGLEQFLQWSLERRRAVRDPGDPLIAASLRMLGRYYLRIGQLDEAQRRIEETLVILQAYYPESHRRIGRVTSELGEVYLARGQYERAQERLLAGFRVLSEDLTSFDDEKREALERIVRLYQEWGKDDEAAEWNARLES